MASFIGPQFEWGQSSTRLATSTSFVPYDNKSDATVPKSRSMPTGSRSPAPSPAASSRVPQVPRASDTFQIPPAVETPLSKIQAMNFYATGIRSMTIPNISSATWLNLKDASESSNHKLEYWSPTETVVVTHASGVHEAVHVLCKPFMQIAHAYEKLFLTEWNRDVRITLQDGQYMDLTPDFAFGEEGHPKPKYRIVFECAWAQSYADLNKKVEDWFHLDDVIAVVCLHITERPKFASPTLPAAEYCTKSQEEFFAQTGSRAPFGAVVFENMTWVSAISAITLNIHHRQHTTESFNIKPPPPGEDTAELRQAQGKVDAYLVGLLRDVITFDRLQEYLHDRDTQFNLNWDTFYEKLEDRLQFEGHKRYTSWALSRVTRGEKRLHPARGTLVPRSTSGDEELLQLVRKKPKVE
ncbi:hypothetical protein MSAN_01987700 [Mycena sanguinolenta]|uniref:Uncharacterized protein n=1 Tax=Mycena sanguinolenta TaxID=230812 RepID=A0A8H6XLP4_9AGAR|nr:hypothetical protein MSAN_01987700 [Mycena sanguinolenta]